MFRTIAAVTAVLTTVALLSSATQSVEPTVVVAHDLPEKVRLDASGAMIRHQPG